MTDASTATLPTTHVWRQIVCVSTAWVALLVSLIALPGLLMFTIIAFAGIFVAVAISWTSASRVEPVSAWPARSALPRA